jgi:hypothetical protein
MVQKQTSENKPTQKGVLDSKVQLNIEGYVGKRSSRFLIPASFINNTL